LIEPYIFECELQIDTKKYYRGRVYNLNSRQKYEEYKDQIFEEYYDYQKDDLNFNAFTIKLQKWYCKNSDREEVLQRTIDEIGDKVIVFCRFLESIPKGTHKITGEENLKERRNIIKEFKDGKFQVLYLTYGCGAYGLNLQFCKNIIFAEQVWDYALQVQAEARIYRLGQAKEVAYYTLYCGGVGLEDLMEKCISRKSTLLDTIKSEIAKTKGGVKEWVKSL
jgi:SNF2 family DNA or RNA helicase